SRRAAPSGITWWFPISVRGSARRRMGKSLRLGETGPSACWLRACPTRSVWRSARAGAFGTDLFVVDINAPTDPGGGLFKISSAGAVTRVAAPFLEPEAVAFDTSGRFGGDAFVSDLGESSGTGGGTGTIYRVTPTGMISTFATGSPLIDPVGLAFGP